MLPLISFHAIAAQRGDGLHPLLLAGLQRLATKRVEHAAEPTADGVTRKETAKAACDLTSCIDAMPGTQKSSAADPKDPRR